MQRGDIVYHKETGKRLQVKLLGMGNGMVLCCWPEKDRNGVMLECTGAYSWLDLRPPTWDELHPATVVSQVPLPADHSQLVSPTGHQSQLGGAEPDESDEAGVLAAVAAAAEAPDPVLIGETEAPAPVQAQQGHKRRR